MRLRCLDMITPRLAPATLPPDERIYAIGDVHGCLDRLATMHRLIGEDIASRPIGSVTIIHLGDLIDRGPDSAGVVALMLEPWTTSPAPHVVNLMGNHEDMMLTALAVGDVGSVRHWMSNGGAETLHSWGISHRAPPETWWAEIPPVHLGFLRGLSLMHRAGGYAFVHAGVRPSVPLEQQSRTDLLWIREPFLSSDQPLQRVIVHGHTPIEEPVVRHNRIGIDTGAVLGGVLTCAVLEGETLDFLQS